MTAIIDIRPAHETMEGDGVTVKRLMPIRGFMNYDPFVLWDHFTISAGTGFPDHPHRGFEAITYLFTGAMRHEDNLGNRSTVVPGGAQRFTAGRGLVHSEMPGAEGATSGIQLWINLPRRLKDLPPDYQQVESNEFPEHAIENGSVRVIVGEGSPLRLQTPVRYLDVRLESGGCFEEAVAAGHSGLAYVVEGVVRIGEQTLSAGDACFFHDLMALTVRADQAARFMVCHGQPHGEPIRQHGPFVD